MAIDTWWGGAARRRMSEDILSIYDDLREKSSDKENVDLFDKKTRLKVYILYGTFVACFLAYYFLPFSVYLSVALAIVMGFFAIPYLRVFMHSEMHWGVGSKGLSRVFFKHFLSLLFSVSQTGYVYGHRAHHRYDNDYNPSGFPKDLQSTYIFSKSGRPTNPLVWLAFYVLVYQQFIHAYLVFSGKVITDKIWMIVELAVIVAFHSAMYIYFFDFYLFSYLPALLIAWVGSGIVLYMMHSVDADSYKIHPTNNSLSKFFNTFGDNDGYHLEHSLFPSIHPKYLKEMAECVDLDDSQNLKDHYVIAFFKLKRNINEKTEGVTYE